MSDNVIEAQNLTKPMAKTTVVKGISFSVGRAERALPRRQRHRSVSGLPRR